MGAELFRADVRTDGMTDMTKLIVAFRNFENTSNNEQKNSKKHSLPLRFTLILPASGFVGCVITQKTEELIKLTYVIPL